MTDKPQAENNNDKASVTAKGAFSSTALFARKNWMQTTAILGSVLLGTTALATPLLTGTLAAGALMVGSFFLLSYSSDALIDHSSAIGKKMKVSPLLIGLGLGALTSMPELCVSMLSVFKGAPELGVGNIVGSNIANILLILGATAAIAGIRKGSGLSWSFNNKAMIGATAAFGGILALGFIHPLMGIAMLGAGILYMKKAYDVSQKDMAAHAAAGTLPAEEKIDDRLHPQNMPGWFNGAWGIAGLTGLVLSADVLVNSATRFATGLGVSQALVGALAVAVGTSLPELIVNIKAALKKDTDVALGNILGSNIFNILAVGGAVGAVGLTVPGTFAPVSPQGILNFTAFGASAGLLALVLKKGEGAIKKWQGYAGMALYAAFAAASVMLDKGAVPAGGMPDAAATQAIVTPASLPAPVNK